VLMKMIKRIARASLIRAKHACFYNRSIFFFSLSSSTFEQTIRARSCDPRRILFRSLRVFKRCLAFRLLVCACESREIRSKTCQCANFIGAFFLLSPLSSVSASSDAFCTTERDQPGRYLDRRMLRAECSRSETTSSTVNRQVSFNPISTATDGVLRFRE